MKAITKGNMKQTLRFLMLLAIALSMLPAACCPALAEEAGTAEEDPYVPARIRSNYSTELWVSEREGGEVDYEVLYSGQDRVELEAELELEDGREYEVVYDSKGKIIYAEYEEGDSEIFYDGSTWRDENGNETEGPDLYFMHRYYEDYRPEYVVYKDNTMCVVGLPLRELYPNLTDKWYHILPVDLTQEGVFQYQLAAGNMYYIGICEVTIGDGKVTVDYGVPYGQIDIGRQCLAWFTDISEITPEFLDDPRSSFRFGTPVDIQEDLQGKDTALLFICNRVTYRLLKDNKKVFLRRFHSGGIAMNAYKQELMELLARME